MGYSNFFNLIANVIRSGINHHSFINADVLQDEATSKINQEIGEMLSKTIGYKNSELHDKFLFDSEECEGIINWCKERNDKYIYIYLLRQFDRMINIDVLCSEYGIEKTAKRNREEFKAQSPASLKGVYIDPGFQALNTNAAETEIILLPNLRALVETDDEDEEANTIARMSGLNDVLQQVSYFQVNDMLQGFKIKNVIMNPEREFEKLTVCFTPTTCKSKEEAFEIGNDIIDQDDEGHDCKYMGEITLRDKPSSTKNFTECLKCCRKEGFDILIGTEMFGTEDLCETGASGTNPLFANEDNSDNPFMIVTPSLWKNSSNVVSVFSAGGELIGKQNKQFPYTYRGKKKEHLKNIPREILLIHVRGLGKISFPICYDFLNDEYRKFLIDKLKTDFIICPSYSSKSIDFEKDISDAVSRGSFAFWMNSCSAIAQKKTNTGIIGLVLIPTEKTEDSAKRICTDECCKSCGTCMFAVTVPVKREGRLKQVKGNIDIRHVMV